AADEGWMPQSAEHLAVLNALDVRHGVLAVTRSDLADPTAATQSALEAIAATSLGAMPAIAVSAVTDTGLTQLRAALGAMTAKLPRAENDAPVRLWIDRSFTVKGAGTVVTGTLTAGTIRIGDELVVTPGTRATRVRGLQTTGADRDAVSGVSRVAINLRGIEPDDVGRGDALVTPDAWTSTSEIDVRLRLDDGHADTGPRVPAPAEATNELPTHAVLHIGSAALPVRIRPLGDARKHLARLTIDGPLPMHVADRGLLRDPGLHRVVAGFTVLDVRPPALSRRGAAAARADELVAAGEFVDVETQIRRRGVVRHRDLVAMGYRPFTEPTAGWHIAAAELDRLITRLRDELARWLAEHPLDQGLPIEAARYRLGLPDAALVDVVRRAAGLASTEGRIVSQRPAALPQQLLRAVATLADELSTNPFAAPDAERLRALRLGPAELAAADRAGLLLRVDNAIVLAAGADHRAAKLLAALPQPFTLSQARQALSTSRRVAVPLMEFLDRHGVTRRFPDDTRQIVENAIRSPIEVLE
ncbi:MAG: SelB C-terminal domain-containing protein, partial [Acidothermaceae bacterium]